jgi:LPS sulfotransferase NodH
MISLVAMPTLAGAVDLLQAGQPAPRQGILLDVPTSFRVLAVLEDYPKLEKEAAALRELVVKQQGLDEIRIEREKLYQERIAFLEMQSERWKQLNDSTLALAKQNREMQGSWWDRFLADMGKMTTGAIIGGVIAAAFIF